MTLYVMTFSRINVIFWPQSLKILTIHERPLGCILDANV